MHEVGWSVGFLRPPPCKGGNPSVASVAESSPNDGSSIAAEQGTAQSSPAKNRGAGPSSSPAKGGAEVAGKGGTGDLDCSAFKPDAKFVGSTKNLAVENAKTAWGNSIGAIEDKLAKTIQYVEAVESEFLQAGELDEAAEFATFTSIMRLRKEVLTLFNGPEEALVKAKLSGKYSDNSPTKGLGRAGHA